MNQPLFAFPPRVSVVAALVLLQLSQYGLAGIPTDIPSRSLRSSSSGSRVSHLEFGPRNPSNTLDFVDDDDSDHKAKWEIAKDKSFPEWELPYIDWENQVEGRKTLREIAHKVFIEPETPYFVVEYFEYLLDSLFAPGVSRSRLAELWGQCVWLLLSGKKMTRTQFTHLNSPAHVDHAKYLATKIYQQPTSTVPKETTDDEYEKKGLFFFKLTIDWDSEAACTLQLARLFKIFRVDEIPETFDSIWDKSRRQAFSKFEYFTKDVPLARRVNRLCGAAQVYYRLQRDRKRELHGNVWGMQQQQQADTNGGAESFLRSLEIHAWPRWRWTALETAPSDPELRLTEFMSDVWMDILEYVLRTSRYNSRCMSDIECNRKHKLLNTVNPPPGFSYRCWGMIEPSSPISLAQRTRGRYHSITFDSTWKGARDRSQSSSSSVSQATCLSGRVASQEYIITLEKATSAGLAGIVNTAISIKTQRYRRANARRQERMMAREDAIEKGLEPFIPLPPLIQHKDRVTKGYPYGGPLSFIQESTVEEEMSDSERADEELSTGSEPTHAEEEEEQGVDDTGNASVLHGIESANSSVFYEDALHPSLRAFLESKPEKSNGYDADAADGETEASTTVPWSEAGIEAASEADSDMSRISGSSLGGGKPFKRRGSLSSLFG